MNPFEDLHNTTQKYQQEQRQRIDKCKAKILEVINELKKLPPEYQNEIYQWCIQNAIVSGEFTLLQNLFRNNP